MGYHSYVRVCVCWCVRARVCVCYHYKKPCKMDDNTRTHATEYGGHGRENSRRTDRGGICTTSVPSPPSPRRKARVSQYVYYSKQLWYSSRSRRRRRRRHAITHESQSRLRGRMDRGAGGKPPTCTTTTVHDSRTPCNRVCRRRLPTAAAADLPVYYAYDTARGHAAAARTHET